MLPVILCSIITFVVSIDDSVESEKLHALAFKRLMEKINQSCPHDLARDVVNNYYNPLLEKIPLIIDNTELDHMDDYDGEWPWGYWTAFIWINDPIISSLSGVTFKDDRIQQMEVSG
eukprot:399052_1